MPASTRGGTLPSVPVMAASSRQFGAGAKVHPFLRLQVTALDAPA